ncbi:uncharacterized protein LOC143034935 [Oratosquilla oratoria]|uniref:uncharacterized protein LOC143034935 n=1 Tax=Oratosquilla oratoria TaxID=337810 RepID=UPI003F76136D
MVRAWLTLTLVVTTALSTPVPDPDHPLPAGGFTPLSAARGPAAGYAAPPQQRAIGPASGGPTKTIYVNVPQPPPPQPLAPIPGGPPRKHYKIVFIRSPSPPPAPQPIVPPRTEQKTLIYVLYQKPKVDGPQLIEVPDVKHSPEVFFVQYDKPPTTEQLQQLSAGNLQGLSGPGTISLSGLAGAPAPINTYPPAILDSSAELQIGSASTSIEEPFLAPVGLGTGLSSGAVIDSVFSGSAPAPAPIAPPAPLIDVRFSAESAEGSIAPASGVRPAVGGSVSIESLGSGSVGTSARKGLSQASISPATQISASFGVPFSATRTGTNNVIDSDISQSPGRFFLRTDSVELDDQSSFGSRVPSLEVLSHEILSSEQLDSLDDLDDQIGLGLLAGGNNVLAG